MSKGSPISVPTWKAFMTEALKKYPAPAFEKPLPDPDYATLKPVLRGVWMGNKSVWLDKFTMMRATENTPLESRIEKVITNVQDILYWVDKTNPRGPAPSNPYSDPQFTLWNTGVQKWWEENKSNYNVITESDLPTEYENIHTIENKPVISIGGLPTQLTLTDRPTISIGVQNQYPLTTADIFINNTYITTLNNPFRFIFNPNEYGYTPGVYTLKVVATNSIYATNTKDQAFTITQ
jgi:hypothetical protein